jgi:hypothetical protein
MLGKQEIIAPNKGNWLSYTKRDFDIKSLCLQECSNTLQSVEFLSHQQKAIESLRKG